MQFKSVFIAVFLGTALLVSALLVNSQRPSADTDRATVAHVRATGKCVECHRAITPAVVHEFETSAHVAKGGTCLDCHPANPGQPPAAAGRTAALYSRCSRSPAAASTVVCRGTPGVADAPR